jgi:F0F1-type ATP synthase delta subunit
MSLSKKLITAYSKSLFESNKDIPISINEEDFFDISNLTSLEINKVLADIYLIGEELLLLKSLILSSKITKSFFRNPTYSEKLKLNILLSIFPGLTVSTKSFLRFLTERSHLFLIPPIANEYSQMVLKFKSSITVKLFIAAGFDENSGSLLLSTLKELTYAEEVLLKVFYSRKFLGGLIVEYNSIETDLSILKELSLFFSEK